MESGYGKKEDLNCAEKILKGANISYGLGLDEACCRMISGFGKGICIEHLCGAVAAAVAVLSKLFTKEREHEGQLLSSVVQEFLISYEAEMDSIICKSLAEKYRTPEKGCHDVILKAAEVLDKVVLNNKEQIAIKCNLN